MKINNSIFLIKFISFIFVVCLIPVIEIRFLRTYYLFNDYNI